MTFRWVIVRCAFVQHLCDQAVPGRDDNKVTRPDVHSLQLRQKLRVKLRPRNAAHVITRVTDRGERRPLGVRCMGRRLGERILLW